MIPLEELGRANRSFETDLRRAFAETLTSGRYVLGEQVEAFEREFAAALGARRAVGVGSGYDAITLALRALGLRRGEVVLPANTFTGTALAVVRCGLVPVFAEPDPATLLLDPERAARRVGPRTVAILPVHLYGLACDMRALSDLARRRGLRIVEDCAQAHGAFFEGQPVGTFGDAAAFSFYPTKTLGGLGDGGAVVTGEAAVADRVRTLRNYGFDAPGRAAVVGLNSRLDELQAAFLRVKLPRLGEIVRRRNEIAARYDRELAPVFVRPHPAPGARPARSVYPILHPRRDELAGYLASRGIGTGIHYPVPPYRQRPLLGKSRGRFPLADRLHRTTLSLPLSFGMPDAEVACVIEAMNNFAEGAGAERSSPAPREVVITSAAALRAPSSGIPPRRRCP